MGGGGAAAPGGAPGGAGGMDIEAMMKSMGGMGGMGEARASDCSLMWTSCVRAYNLYNLLLLLFRLKLLPEGAVSSTLTERKGLMHAMQVIKRTLNYTASSLHGHFT